MGKTQTSEDKTYGYFGWKVVDKDSFNINSYGLKTCSNVQSTLDGFLKDPKMKERAFKLGEGITKGMVGIVGSAGNVLAITQLIVNITGCSEDSTEKMLKEIKALLGKMDKKLDTIKDFQNAFQTGFLKSKQKNAFFLLNEYNSRKKSDYLVQMGSNLIEYLENISHMNEAVNCENKQYHWINQTLTSCWLLKGLLLILKKDCKDELDLKTLQAMIDQVVATEKDAKKQAWRIIQTRFKLLKTYVGNWIRYSTKKLEKYEYFFEDEAYTGLSVSIPDLISKKTHHRDRVLVRMFKELVDQLGFKNQPQELATFLKEFSEKGNIKLEFNEKWGDHSWTRGDTWYEEYKGITEVQYPAGALFRQIQQC